MQSPSVADITVILQMSALLEVSAPSLIPRAAWLSFPTAQRGLGFTELQDKLHNLGSHQRWEFEGMTVHCSPQPMTAESRLRPKETQ